jgi:NADP-dependent 3-hydroxy acid dehydrogenase YdfG
MTATDNLSSRRILVTGASSGIGAATCRTLVQRGASVIMVARRKERLDELQEALGARAIGIRGDVTDLDALPGVVEQGVRALGGIDAVIAVAGRGMVGTIATGTPDVWHDLMSLNLVGPLATVRAALEHFPEHGRRDVVFVGSTGGITPVTGLGIYAATKRGLRAAADALRLELAPRGIGVTIMMPGMFETEGLGPDVAVQDGEMPDWEHVPLFVPGQGAGPPEVVAETIAFALSLPEGVTINELVVRPTGQLNP